MNNSCPVVSVIIPTYNGSDYICEAIDSVFLQENVSFEIVVVDDGSTDDTWMKLQKYGTHIKCFKKNNGGVASARNFGLLKSSGKYIALLDQDDRFLPGKLDAQILVMDSNDSVVLCHANIKMIDEEGHDIKNGFLIHDSEKPPSSGFILEELFKWNTILACTVLVRRDVLNRVNGFNESLWGVDDYEAWLKLSLQGDIIYLNKQLSEYRWHSSNASRDTFKMSLGRLMARDVFLQKNKNAKELLGRKIISSVFIKHAKDFSFPLYKLGETEKARKILQIAIRYAPFSLILWKMYAASFFY